MGTSEATFYNWKKKYGGLGVTELRRLRQLEEENFKLKQIVADLSLDKQMLQDVLKKSSKASSEEGAGRGINYQLPVIPEPGVQCGGAPALRMVLQGSSQGGPAIATAH